MDGIELKPYDVRKSRSVVTLSIIVCVFSHRISLSSTSEMLYRYGSILPRSTLLAMLLCLASYKQCSTRLLKMLNKRCNTDMLGVLLIYLHSPSGAACPWDCVYISVKPLAAVLQPINTEYMPACRIHYYVPAVVVMVETCCPLILVTTLLLVVKHSTTLSVVTGLVIV